MHYLFVSLLVLLFSAPMMAQDSFEDRIAAIKELPPAEQIVQFQQALVAGQATPLQRARYHHELGVLHFIQDDLFAAIEQTEKALELRLADEAAAGESVLQSAYNLGSFYHNLNDAERAFDRFQLIVDRAPNSRLGYTLFRLGSIYRDLGEFELGEQAFREAAAQSPFTEDRTEKATLLVEWADLHLKQRADASAAEAIPLLRQAFAIYDELAAGDDFYAGPAVVSLNRLGLAFNYLEDFNTALSFFQQALDYNQRCCRDRDLEASVLTNMGIARRGMGQAEPARELHQRALALRLELAAGQEVDISLARAYDNLASTLGDLQAYGEALETVQQALARGVPGFSPSDPADLPDLSLFRQTPHKNSLLTYLQDKGDLWLARAESEGRREYFDQAVATYQRCDQLIDLIREDHLEKRTKLYWRDQARDMYQAAVLAAWKGGQPDMAFYFSEKSRSVLLMDGLQQLNASTRLPESTRQQLAALAARIQFLERAAYEQGSKLVTEPEDPLSVLRAQYRYLLDSVERAYPDYYRQKYRPEYLTLAQLQERLPEGEMWVEYFLAGHYSLALVIDRNNIRIHELGDPNTLLPDIQAFLRELKTYDRPFRPEPAYALYRRLIEPLALPDRAQLTLVPDGQLSLIPFEALLAGLPNTDDYGQWDFMLRRHRISYAFSAASHYLYSMTNDGGNGRLLAFAPMAELDPEYGVDAALELPQTRFTVAFLSELFPTDTYLGKVAQRDVLHRMAPAAGILHLATHAYLDHERPEYSYFLVADREPEARRFYVSELYQQQYRAELAVLSACETGAGTLYRGEGVASIGRAFAQNGCPNLTMSLWPIDEGATSRLLEAYYRKLHEGVPKAEALHRAKLEYLEDGEQYALLHPFRWAGLVYYGQDDPLQLHQGPFQSLTVLLIAGGVLLLLGLVFYRKRRTD